MRRRCAGSATATSGGALLARRNREPARASDRRRCDARAAAPRRRNRSSTRSQLRRPIFRPSEKAPSGSSDTGIVGWPTRPRSGASRCSRPSACSRFMIAEVDCTERPVSPRDLDLGQAARNGAPAKGSAARCRGARPPDRRRWRSVPRRSTAIRHVFARARAIRPRAGSRLPPSSRPLDSCRFVDVVVGRLRPFVKNNYNRLNYP